MGAIEFRISRYTFCLVVKKRSNQTGCLGTLEVMRRLYINPIKNGQRHDANYDEIAVAREAVSLFSEK